MFFDFHWTELIVVMVVALIVIGPKEIPGALRALGRIVGQLRRTANEFRRHFDETVREAGGEDLQRELHELRHNNPISEIRNTVENAARDITNPTSLHIDDPASTGQPQAGAQTAAGDAKASSASSSAPEKASDAASDTPAPTDNGAPANNDKPTVK